MLFALHYIFILLSLWGVVFLSFNQFFDGQIISKWLTFVAFLLIVVFYNAIKQFTSHTSELRVFCGIQDMLPVLCIVISTLSLYGILQYFNVVRHQVGAVVTGSYDNPAGFAVTLSSTLPLILLGTVHRNRRLSILCRFTLILSLISLGLSESRAGLISAVLVFILGGNKLFVKHSYVKWLLIVLYVILIICISFKKIDSSSGRLLIWICSFLMIKESWLFGYGHGGYEAHYMDFQASYLEQNADSPYVMLADTVQCPFNEFLNILSDYGVVGLAVVLMYIGYMFYKYINNRTYERLAAFLTIISVVVFSLFSYPLMYPYVWMLLLFVSEILIADTKVSWRPAKWFRISFATIAIALCFYSVYRVYMWSEAQIKWKKVALSGVYNTAVISEYKDLYCDLSHDRYFMYNYSYALYMSGDYDTASITIGECRKLWADYDVEMLQGMIAEKKNLYTKAESCYICATNMCPNRFRPLYCLMKLYEKTGNMVSAKEYAEIILTKTVKIQSSEVECIKREALMCIETSS